MNGPPSTKAFCNAHENPDTEASECKTQVPCDVVPPPRCSLWRWGFGVGWRMCRHVPKEQKTTIQESLMHPVPSGPRARTASGLRCLLLPPPVPDGTHFQKTPSVSMPSTIGAGIDASRQIPRGIDHVFPRPEFAAWRPTCKPDHP